MADKHILIVDDHETTRHRLTVVFEREGYRVQTAANGWQALDAVARASFDLILTDLDTPLLGEEELARGLRQRYVRTPVIAMSTDPTRLAPTSGLVVAAVIGKPFPHATLLAVVHDILEGPEKLPGATHDQPA